MTDILRVKLDLLCSGLNYIDFVKVQIKKFLIKINKYNNINSCRFIVRIVFFLCSIFIKLRNNVNYQTDLPIAEKVPKLK